MTKDVRILAQGAYQSNDTRLTGINNNDLIIGPSGAGKTRGYVIPNILHAQHSLLVTDTKGSLRHLLGPHLQARGYQVQDVDLVELSSSEWGYNPLDFIRRDPQTGEPDEADIRALAALLCPVESRGRNDPYWEQAAQSSIAMLIAFVLTRLQPQDQTLAAVCKLAELEGTDQLAAMFRELAECDPDCFAVRLYRQVHINDEAEKMVASVRGIMVNKLSALSTKGGTHLFTHRRRIDFAQLGHTKTALFLKVSDSDRSMDRLANVFYSQAIQMLNRAAEERPECALEVPVRLILDDFATNTVIPGFDKIITTIRSRGIAVSLVVQDLSQLESLYSTSQAKTIANNCDTWLYLGGQDLDTAKVISTKMDRRVASVLNMPTDQTVLMVRGQLPRFVERYDLEADTVYREVVGIGPFCQAEPVEPVGQTQFAFD